MTLTTLMFVIPGLAYKIWRLSLQLFWRYDCGHPNWKWVVWPWSRPF